ncbi:MAG: hypothetical protein IJX17_05875 [Clostridia bacterium]|nr:hypothetical protein [Clostridia bacterium]
MEELKNTTNEEVKQTTEIVDNSSSDELKEYTQESELQEENNSLKPKGKSFKEKIKNNLDIIYPSIALIVSILGLIFFITLKQKIINDGQPTFLNIEDKKFILYSNVSQVVFAIFIIISIAFLVLNIIAKEKKVVKDNDLSAKMEIVNQEKEVYEKKTSFKIMGKNLKEIFSNILAVIYSSVALVISILGLIFFNGLEDRSIDNEQLITSCNIMQVVFIVFIVMSSIILVVGSIMNIIRVVKNKKNN